MRGGRKKRQRRQRRPADRARGIDGFVLGELQGSSPGTLLRGPEDRVGRVMLALALMYNDAKDVFLLAHWARRLEPPASRKAERGECAGIIAHVERMAAALVHELLEAISAEREVFEGEELKRVVAAMPPQSRRAWSELVRLALEPGATMPVTTALRDIRNRAAFHYFDRKALVDGFRAHFVSDPRSPLNDAAYWCVGTTMGRTRFHYADAAAQRFMKLSGTNRQIDDINVLISDLGEFLNNSLRYLLEGFIRAREHADGGAVSQPDGA